MRILVLLTLVVILCGIGCKRPEYKTGEEVFHNVCVKCHKLNGKGGKKGPELTEIFKKKDEQYIRTYIMDPRSIKADGTMPPAKISDHELDLVVQYLKDKGRGNQHGIANVK